MRRWSMVGVTVVLLASAALVAPTSAAAAATDGWSTENGGPGNARLNPGETTLTPQTAPSARLRWTRSENVGARGAPTVVDGVGYEVVNPRPVDGAARFQAFAVDTGETLWSLALPRDGRYPYGVSVVGTVAVMAFDGQSHPGGVTAVGLQTRRVLWSARQPAPVVPALSAPGNRTAGPVVADFTRVYLLGGTNTISTFRLVDGTVDWTVPSGTTRPAGIALANKVVYTGGANSVVAYDTETGDRLWAAPGVGAPVVAAGRVVTASGSTITAVAAAGCGGAARCGTLWQVELPYPDMSGTAIGGVDGETGYLTYTDAVRDTGGIVRFSAISGKVFWRAPLTSGGVAPVRGASTVWTVAGGTTLVGFSTTAKGGKPLRSIVEPAAQQSPGQTLAIAAGKVFVRSAPRSLSAYGLAAG